jgi:hypothetical protein
MNAIPRGDGLFIELGLNEGAGGPLVVTELKLFRVEN